MSADGIHIRRLFPARLRMSLLVLAALLFGQFAASAHTHDDYHDDAPIACDVCLSAYSDEDDILDTSDDEPERLDAPVYILSSELSLPQDIVAPGFDRAPFLRNTYIDVGRRPNAARAPPH